MTLSAPLVNAHAAAPRSQDALYQTIALLIDTRPRWGRGRTQATTLQPNSRRPAPADLGDTQSGLASLTGRAAGDMLQIDHGSNAEIVTIASIVDRPRLPAPDTERRPDERAARRPTSSGSAVYLPSIVDGMILQSQTLTPTRTDPRRRDATDTVANGSGGSAIRRMTVDGEYMIPQTLR